MGKLNAENKYLLDDDGAAEAAAATGLEKAKSPRAEKAAGKSKNAENPEINLGGSSPISPKKDSCKKDDTKGDSGPESKKDKKERKEKKADKTDIAREKSKSDKESKKEKAKNETKKDVKKDSKKDASSSLTASAASAPAPKPPKKKGGFFSWFRKKLPTPSISLVSSLSSWSSSKKSSIVEKIDVGVNTTEKLMDAKGVSKAIAVSALAHKLQPKRKAFFIWSTGMRERQRQRMQYVGESLLQLKKRDFEKQIQELIRERDILKDCLIEHGKKEEGFQHRLECKTVEEMQQLIETSCRESTAEIPNTLIPGSVNDRNEVFATAEIHQKHMVGNADKRVYRYNKATDSLEAEQIKAESPRASWDVLYKSIQIPMGPPMALELTGPLCLELVGPEQTVRRMKIFGPDCRVWLKNLSGMEELELRENSIVYTKNCDIDRVCVRQHSRFFANKSFVTDYTQHDEGGRGEFVDSNLLKNAQCFGGVFLATRCKFLGPSGICLYLKRGGDVGNAGILYSSGRGIAGVPGSGTFGTSCAMSTHMKNYRTQLLSSDDSAASFARLSACIFSEPTATASVVCKGRNAYLEIASTTFESIVSIEDGAILSSDPEDVSQFVDIDRKSQAKYPLEVDLFTTILSQKKNTTTGENDGIVKILSPKTNIAAHSRYVPYSEHNSLIRRDRHSHFIHSKKVIGKNDSYMQPGEWMLPGEGVIHSEKLDEKRTGYHGPDGDFPRGVSPTGKSQGHKDFIQLQSSPLGRWEPLARSQSRGKLSSSPGYNNRTTYSPSNMNTNGNAKRTRSRTSSAARRRETAPERRREKSTERQREKSREGRDSSYREASPMRYTNSDFATMKSSIPSDITLNKSMKYRAY